MLFKAVGGGEVVIRLLCGGEREKGIVVIVVHRCKRRRGKEEEGICNRAVVLKESRVGLPVKGAVKGRVLEFTPKPNKILCPRADSAPFFIKTRYRR